MALTVSYGGSPTTLSTWTTTITTLADGSGSDSETVTNSSPGIQIECKITGTATTSTGTADLYLIESVDNSDFSDTGTGDAGNARYIGSVTLNTNTAVVKIISAGNLPKYWKLRVVNNSGGAFTAASFAYETVTYTDV